MTKPRTYFTFYRSFYEQICECPDKDARLEMYEVLLEYLLNGTEPDLEGGELSHYTRFFWKGNWPVLKKNRSQFERSFGPKEDSETEPTSSQRRANVEPHQSQPQTYNRGIESIEVVYSKQPKKNRGREGEQDGGFIPPSLDDIKVYYLSKHGHPVNEKIASKFINYYAARGWNMGRSMMTDWQAAFEQWCAREDEYNDKHIQDNESTKQTTKQCCGEHGQQREQRTDEDGRNGKGRSLDEEVW